MFSFLFQASAFARGEIKAFKPSSSSRRHQKQAASFVVHAAASGKLSGCAYTTEAVAGVEKKTDSQGRSTAPAKAGRAGMA